MISKQTVTIKPSSSLAKVIFRKLLNTPLPDQFTCKDTGEVIEGYSEYSRMVTFNPNALGPYFKVYGYYYILCFWAKTRQEYIAIHHEHDKKLMGWMRGYNNIEVLVGRTKAASGDHNQPRVC